MEKIKKNDLVKVLSGKDRGKSGRVLKVLPKDNLVVVEGLNIRKRHRRPKRQGEKGQVVQVPSPIHISNAMLICPSCSKPQRTKSVLDDKGHRTRVCRKCGAKIP
ncbi:MAG: 50S ribosomal protein L24 [Candidatus Niyogibacteria bacterium]|nr:MAG: 50S ribosomal protein L24 [Candidatus Niyogibacteria bacterium]